MNILTSNTPQKRAKTVYLPQQPLTDNEKQALSVFAKSIATKIIKLPCHNAQICTAKPLSPTPDNQLKKPAVSVLTVNVKNANTSANSTVALSLLSSKITAFREQRSTAQDGEALKNS